MGGVYDFGFRHDPDNPLETLAEYCLGVYTNRSLPQRVDMLVNNALGQGQLTLKKPSLLCLPATAVDLGTL